MGYGVGVWCWWFHRGVFEMGGVTEEIETGKVYRGNLRYQAVAKLKRTIHHRMAILCKFEIRRSACICRHARHKSEFPFTCYSGRLEKRYECKICTLLEGIPGVIAPRISSTGNGER